jgi:hypothetical protein
VGNFTFVRRRESRRLVTLVLLVAFLFGLAGGLAPVRVGAQTTPGTPTLDGRIGGTVAAFEAKFGEPTNKPTDDVSAKRTYKNKNYQYLTTQAIDGYVYRVTFSADRKGADPETKKTWSKSKATSVAKRIIPSDAECGEASPYKGKKALRVTCTSAALTAIMFPADYQRVGRAGDQGSVSFVLTLDKKDDAKVTAIETIVGSMSAAEFAATQPAPTATPAPDPYFASGPATEAEKAYFRQVQGIILLLAATTLDVTDITSDPSVSSNIVLWYQLLDALSPYHTIYAQWTAITAPTARLEVFHQTITDAVWNYDQMATNLALGINNLDPYYITLGTSQMQAGTDAIGRATDLMAAWEAETGFDVSEDL